MSTYESIGTAFVILTSLFGISAFLFLAWHGVEVLRGRLAIGKMEEDAAVRDQLGQKRPEIHVIDRNAHLGSTRE